MKFDTLEIKRHKLLWQIFINGELHFEVKDGWLSFILEHLINNRDS